MWIWVIVGLVGLAVLLVAWSCLVMGARADDEMREHRLKNNKDHRLEACATKKS
jgi:type IV secretory pathway TrbD component